MYQFLYYFSIAYLAVAALVYVILIIMLFCGYDERKHGKGLETSKLFYFNLVVISPVLMSLFWIFFLPPILMKKSK